VHRGAIRRGGGGRPTLTHAATKPGHGQPGTKILTRLGSGLCVGPGSGLFLKPARRWSRVWHGSVLIVGPVRSTLPPTTNPARRYSLPRQPRVHGCMRLRCLLRVQRNLPNRQTRTASPRGCPAPAPAAADCRIRSSAPPSTSTSCSCGHPWRPFYRPRY
jgi:hypothetical protein